MEQFQQEFRKFLEEEPETEEELASEVVEEELPQVEETVQEKYDCSLKKTCRIRCSFECLLANLPLSMKNSFEELEELLIMSDVGVQVASNLTEELRYEAKLENAEARCARRVIIEKLVELYVRRDGNYDEQIHFQDGLTSSALCRSQWCWENQEIGHRHKQAGKKVMLVAAADTYAGAVAQLVEWGRRVDVPVVTGPEKG